MNRSELNEIIKKHEKWCRGESGGERADMRGANMSGADMSGANMRHADMRHADMRRANMSGADMSGANMSGANMSGADMSGANMRYANMRHADMSGADMSCADMSYTNMSYADMSGANMRRANIDYSVWPLWCGSLKAHVDDRIAIQLLYHTLSVVQYSPYVSEELKRTLLAPPVVDIANRFHRVDECGELAAYAAEGA